MRIISRYKDTYDWGYFVSHNKDDVVYKRDFDTYYISSTRVKDVVPFGITFIVGDKAVVCETNRPSPFSWDFEGFIEAVGGIKAFQARYPDITEGSPDSITQYFLFQEEDFIGDTPKSKSMYSGKIILSQPLQDFLAWYCEKYAPESGGAKRYREVLGCAPVMILFNLGRGVVEVYENISFMNSGIDIEGIFHEDIGGLIDAYVSTQSTVETVTMDNDTKIVNHGFDKKISFRRRG